MAPSNAPSYVRTLWYKWRSLKLPWRRTWLCGYDLQGNTYWEFRNQLSPGRARRIAHYPPGTHYGDVSLSPAWLQWLRHTRPEPPSLDEQQADVQRQQNMMQLAAAADARWAAKDSYLDSPNLAQAAPQLEPGSGQRASAAMSADQQDPGGVSDRPGGGKQEKKEDPWTKHASSSKETWQPASWMPPSAVRR